MWVKYVFIVLLAGVLVLPGRSLVLAQSITANELIEGVNALRSSLGLAAYQVDSSIMVYAQEHADYMASIQNVTHRHSDGSSPLESGYQENIAGGDAGFMTLDFVINTIWADEIHMKTMVGYSIGAIGAGAAVGEDGQIYMVINVRPGQAVSVIVPTSSGKAADTQSEVSTPTVVEPVVTAEQVSLLDSAQVYTVASGDSLWSIAIQYGVKIDEIRQWNGLAADDNTIFVGQQLSIFLPVTATPEITLEPTAVATATMTIAPATQTPQATATQAPTSTNTIEPVVAPILQTGLEEKPPSVNKITTIIVIVTVAAIGLLLIDLRNRVGRKKQQPEKSAGNDEFG
jgi:LysM repeat protein